MEIEWDPSLAQEDIYRLPKEQLQGILTKFRVSYKEDDNVATLRAIVSAIRNIVKKHNTPTVRDAFNTLVQGKTKLEERVVETYPDLGKIQEYLIERENIYYQVPHRDEGTQTVENKVDEQLPLNRPLPLVPKLEEKMAENLPLISAGTFNGLQSENPNEFIDKYEIAAKSNNWQNRTKVNLFPAHLAGNALAWHTYYTKNGQVDNWEELKTKFIDTFRPVAQANSLQLILDKKVQQRDQSALNYFLEILAICRRYDQDITDKQIINYVIQGLQPEICERILNEKSDTIEELESSLRKIELHRGIQKQNWEKYQRATKSSVDQVRDTQGHYQEYNRGETQTRDLKALETEIRALSNIVSNLSLRDVRERDHSRDRNWQRGRSPSQGRRYQDDEARSYRRQEEHGWPRNQHREQRSSFQGASSRSQGRRVQFQSPGRRVAYQQPHTATGTQRREQFCTICKRTNHNTDNCRFRNNNRSRDYNNKFCRVCRMSNHNTEDCYKNRGARNFQNQKNA